MTDPVDEAIGTARRLITAEIAGDDEAMQAEMADLHEPKMVVAVLVQALASTFSSDDPDDPLKSWREHLLAADLAEPPAGD